MDAEDVFHRVGEILKSWRESSLIISKKVLHFCNNDFNEQRINEY